MSQSPYDEFIRLQSAVVRAVGMMWNPRYEEFKHEFMKDPIAAMEKWLGYTCPFDIKLDALPSGRKNPHVFQPEKAGGWVGTDNGITLVLPPPPADPAEAAEAIAAYNQMHTFFMPFKA